MFKFKNQKGFTLIEVLLVVVILGILAAIAIPRFLTSEEDAQISACNTNLATIRTQIEQFHFDTSAYPTAAQFVAATDADDEFANNTNYFPNGMAAVCPIEATRTYASLYTAGTGVLTDCPHTAP